MSWLSERWKAAKDELIMAAGIGLAAFTGGASLGWAIAIGATGAVALKAIIPDVPDIPQTINENRVQSQLEPEWSRPVLYGETECAGNIVFYNTTGTDNKYLDIVIDVCEGEIKGFEKVYMNDEPIALFDAGAGSEFTHGTQYDATSPLYGGLQAEGDIVFTSIPANSVFYRESQPNIVAGVDYAVGVNLAATLTNLVTYLNSSANPYYAACTYSVVNGNTLHIVHDAAGDAGNNVKFFFRTRNEGYSLENKNVQLSGGRSEVYAKLFAYNGTDAQTVNTQLQSAYAGWDANHALPGAAYVYIRLTYNADLFRGGMPQFKFKLRGKKVYDPRTSTTVYSTNPAVCLRDYLLNTRYGKGLASGDLNNQSIIDAANLCDVTRSGLDVNGSTVTYKSYEISALVDTKNSLKTNVEYFLQAMNGVLPYFDGQYSLNILGAGNATVTLSEDDIIGEISVASTSKKNKLNKVLVSFPDKTRHYKVGEAPFVDSAAYTADGEYLQKSITVPYVDYYPRAKDIAELTVNLSRIKSGITFTTTSKILQAIPGDIVGLTYSTLGWSAKEFRLNQIVIRPDGLCDVTLTEHFDSFYTLTQKQEVPVPNDTTLKSPYNVTKPVITSLISDSTTHLVSVEGLVTPRILVTWSSTEEYADNYIIYKKKSTDSKFTVVGRTDSLDALSYYISDLNWGVQYDVGVQVVNGIGIKSKMAISSITVPNPLTEAIYNFPDVKGLELIGRGTNEGQGNDTEFQGKDIRLQWRLSSNNVTMEFGSTDSEVIGGVGGVMPFTLKGYKVKVFHPGDTQPRQTYTVTDPHFTYTLDKNIEDGLGTPSRTITFEIVAFGQVAGYGVNGESETPAKLIATNSQPDLPTALTIEEGFQSIRINFVRPEDPDYKAIKVWLGTSTGFTRNNASLVYDGPDNNIVLNGLTSGNTYYLRLLAYDDFGSSGATESPEYVVTLPSAISGDEVTSITASKITSGTLAEQVNVAGVFVATGTEAVMNKTFTDSTWRLEMGPVTVGPTTYVMRFHNGTTTPFSIDSAGNAVFGGSLSAASGTLGSLTIDTNGNIKSGQTAYDTGIGFWLGDVSGTKKFSIGNSSGGKLLWDGTDLVTSTLKTSSGTGKRIVLNPSGNNELEFYGNRGDGTIEKLATIGINTVEGDDTIGVFGTYNLTYNNKVAIYASSHSNEAIIARSYSGYGVYSISATSGGVFGASSGSGVGVAGQSTTGTGVEGISYSNSSTSFGVYGYSDGYIGIKTESGSASTHGAFLITPKANTADPTTGGMGEFYVRSDGILRYHQGSVWTTLTNRVAVPSTATSTGSVGQFASDASYLYVCHATNTWKRVAIAAW